jgi:hypothetical protein
MPLLSGGGKNLWISTGLFLFFAILIVTSTEVALLVAMFYPALYSLYSEKAPRRWPYIVAILPLICAFVPSLRFGTIMYAAILASAVIMYLLIKHEKPGLSILLPTLIIFSLFILAVLSISQHSGIGYEKVLAHWADQILNEVQGIYQGFLTPEEMADFQLGKSHLQMRMVTLFPSLVLTSIAIILWVNLLIISSTLKSLHLQEWRCPDWMVVVFITASILTVMGNMTAHAVGLNLLIIAGQVYFFQGIAIVASFMNQSKWPGYIRWTLYIFILIQVYIMVIVAGIGLFDTWFDFRKRIRTPKGEDQ